MPSKYDPYSKDNRCVFCGKLITNNTKHSSTYSFKYHLETKHLSVWNKLIVQEHPKKKQKVFPSLYNDDETQPTIYSVFSK